MAKLTPPTTVTVEMTTAELALVQRALKLVRDYGAMSDWDASTELLADLEGE
ncbi:hypothetical protein [Kitasatospora fiedleri]|uniref:hypothetical protein n=1 Tax=Kitasatospora fiedleri TaxID=2991545 RepID=UPI00249C94B3|nr:hypothetical protein [Kitasatospora fiedleri]